MYSPVELLVVDWLIPVSSLVSVTLTPGITAFEVSLTVPRIAPASTWANETASPKRLPNSTKTARVSNAEIRSVPIWNHRVRGVPDGAKNCTGIHLGERNGQSEKASQQHQNGSGKQRRNTKRSGGYPTQPRSARCLY